MFYVKKWHGNDSLRNQAIAANFSGCNQIPLYDATPLRESFVEYAPVHIAYKMAYVFIACKQHNSYFLADLNDSISAIAARADRILCYEGKLQSRWREIQ